MRAALELLAVVALVLATGFFVAAEFGYVAVRRSRLEEAERSGSRSGIRSMKVMRRLSFMLSGAQLGITLTSLLLGFLAEPVLAELLRPVLEATPLPDTSLDSWSVVSALLLATVFAMVFGELVPKNLAIARSEATTRALALPILVYLAAFGWLIHVFDAAANRLLRLVGVEPVSELHSGVSIEELDVIVEASAKTGDLTKPQADLLIRALGFGELNARDAMVSRSRVTTIHAHATGTELIDLVEAGHARFPVVPDDGDLDDVDVVVHGKDLLRVPLELRDTFVVAQLGRPVVAVPESAPLSTVLDLLRGSHSELALVVDEYGTTSGILTLEDLIEELVGSIIDEYDRGEVAVRQRDDGSWVIPGWWRLDEVFHDCGIQLPEGEYATVAGLLLEAGGEVPDVGDTFVVETDQLPRDLDGDDILDPVPEMPPAVRFDVLELRGAAVARVLMTPLDSYEGDEP